MTTTTHAAASSRVRPVRVNLVLATLFLGTFVLGTAELGVVGMLNLIAGDLGVSVSAVGTLVTAYALGLAIGGPVLAALTIRVRRRPLLVWALVIYLAVTLLAVSVSNLGLFIIARVLTGSVHGLFVGVAFTVAVSVVPPERVGRAMAAVIGGFAVSAALGLPLGRLIGQAVGWRGAFVTFVIMGAACLIAMVAVIPPVESNRSGGITAQVRHALAPRVLALLGLALMLFAGQYATLTYITPFLQQVTGISGAAISVFLLAYGAATALGVFAGGQFADKAASRTLVVANTVLIAAFVVLLLARTVPVLVAVALIGWGLFGMGLVPSLQYRVVSLAGPGRDLAATLPASAINGGIAVGALAGGWAIANHSASSVVLVGLVISVLALPVAWATGFLKPPQRSAAELSSAAAPRAAPGGRAGAPPARGEESPAGSRPRTPHRS